MNNKSNNTGLFLALASPVAFSCFNIGVRVLTGEVSVWELLFLRGCIGVAVILVVARILKKRLWGSHRGLLLLIGFIGFLSTACTTTAITLIPLYQAMVILYLYPSLAIVLSALINRERINSRDGLGVGLALTGCVLLIWPDETAGLDFQIGHLIGLLGSLFYSLSYVLTRRLGEDNCGLEPIFHYSLFAALGAIPLGLVFGVQPSLNSVTVISACLALGALGSLGQMMGYAALRWLPAYKVGVFGTLEVLGGVLASWLLFNDPMTIRTVIGGAVIIAVAFGLRRPAAIGGNNEKDD